MGIVQVAGNGKVFPSPARRLELGRSPENPRLARQVCLVEEPEAAPVYLVNWKADLMCHLEAQT